MTNLAKGANVSNGENAQLTESMTTANEHELGWLSGVIDGEGSFYLTLTHDRNGVRVFKYSLAVGNTNRPLIEEVKRIVSIIIGREIRYLPIKQGRKQNRPAYLLQVTSREGLRAVCLAVLPYLVAKKGQCETMLQFIALAPRRGCVMDSDVFEERSRLMSRMKYLNHRRFPHESPSVARDLTASPRTGVKEKSALHGNMQRTAEMSVPLSA